MVVGSISPNTRLGGESCPHERISRKGQQHGVSVSHVRAERPQMLCSRGQASCEPLASLPSYVRGIWRHKHRQGHRKTQGSALGGPPPPDISERTANCTAALHKMDLTTVEKVRGRKFLANVVTVTKSAVLQSDVCVGVEHIQAYTHTPRYPPHHPE